MQGQRLHKTVKWLGEKSSFYREKLAAAGIEPETIREVRDVQKLPFTERGDLLRAPFDFLTLPMSTLLRLQRDSSASLLHMYTNGDIAQNVELMSRALVAAGVLRVSVVGLLGDLSRSCLLDLQYALEVLGTAVIPLGSDAVRAAELLDLIGADTVAGTEQSLQDFQVYLKRAGRNWQDWPLQRLVCLRQGGKAPAAALGDGLACYTIFASDFPGGAWMYSCGQGEGCHLAEDRFLAEIVDFDDGSVIEDTMRPGELVVTTLTAEAAPVLRLRTGERVCRLPGACACGRTLQRLARA